MYQSLENNALKTDEPEAFKALSTLVVMQANLLRDKNRNTKII